MSTPFDIDPHLNSLNGIRRAEPKPFFTGRVWAKLSVESDAVYKPRHHWGWSLSILTAIIVINILLMLMKPEPKPSFVSDYEGTTPDWVMDYTANPSTPIYNYPNR